MAISDSRKRELAHGVTVAARPASIGWRARAQAHASLWATALLREVRRIWRGAASGKLRHSLDFQLPRALRSLTPSAWILALIGAFAAALGAMVLWMALHSRQIVIADTYNSSSNLAFSVEQFVARTMETVDLALKVAVEEVGAGAAITPQEIETLLAERVRESPALASMMVAGPDGHVRFSSVRLPPQSLNLANNDVFRSARNSASLQLGIADPFAPGHHGRHVIFVSQRFNRADGKFAGVAIATLDSDYLQRFFSTLHIGQHGTIALHRIDGTLLVSRPLRDDDIGKNFSASPLFQGMLPWASFGVFPQHYETDGLWRIMGYQRLEKFSMVVEVALSEDDALANWRRTTSIQAAVGVAVLIVFGFMAFALDRELRARMLAHRKLEETVGELSTARLAAEESSRVKGQFLANMSHELRTPLNAVIGYSELLLEDAENDGVNEQKITDLRRINRAGKHLLSLVSDVLDLSKIEAGKVDLSIRRFDLDTLIDDVVATSRPLIMRNGNELVVRRGSDLGSVMGDDTKLRQVILNLVSNAAKFTEGGTVTLEATRERATAGDWICVSVSDTGVGISRDDLPKLFKNFSQVDAGAASRHGGAGLGLALSQKLCRVMGGEITVESDPGRGSRFTMRVPAVLAGEAPPASAGFDRPG
jgi:signal transduction histidine kinase